MTQTTRPISPLRQRMLDDLRMRKLSDTTQSAYIRAVVNFTRFLGRSPDSATAEDLRRYQLHLVETGISRIRLNATITALRFFFGVTLERPEALAKMSTVREPRKLPVVLSRTEVARLIAAPCCRSCLWARFHAQEGTVKLLSCSANNMTGAIGASVSSRFGCRCRRPNKQIPIALRLSPAVSSLEACQTPAR